MQVRIILTGDLEHVREDVRRRALAALSRFEAVVDGVSLTVSYERPGAADRRRGCIARIRARTAAGPIGHQHFGLDLADAVQSVLARTVRALERGPVRDSVASDRRAPQERRAARGSTR